ncbi:MAG: cobalt ECF transporter T component CbiQ [Anaerolineae bacterium]|nr:cobalt ECF transporter T component CbiQ [Anaerolineae bacterium]MDW8072121.1 cobalt ECF transporter T component CbiQ [Anaerolineae bacterium]
MLHNTLDHYHARPSPIHDLDPRVKVVTTLLAIFSVLVLPDGAWVAYGLIWCAMLAVALIAQLEIGWVLRRSLVALPFALVAVTLVFTLPGRTLFTLQLGSWELSASEAGLVRFLSILTRSWLSVQLAILLIATTRIPDLLHALRHLRVPGLLVTILAFMIRYLAVLVDEVARLLRARQARSAAAPRGRAGGSLFWRARVAGNMAGQLFLRSLERSDRIYNAMLARGFRGQYVTIHPHRMRRRDWTALGLAIVALMGIQWLGRTLN